MKRFPLLICLVLLLLLVPVWAAALDTPAPQLKAITPSSGETNTTVSITSLAGTNFARNAGFRLRRSSSRDIAGKVTSLNSSQITGTLNLDKQAPGDYEVCVYNNETSYSCDLTFTITAKSETVSGSSIYFETYPAGATVLLNGTAVGTSVFTYRNATPGTYQVVIRKSGYEDYTGSVTVKEGLRTKFYAPLTQIGAGTGSTAVPVVQIATTVRKSTLNVPTTWPDTTPAPTASPIDPVLVIGAAGAGIGLLVSRR